MRRLEAPNEPPSPAPWVIEDELDRLDPLRDPSSRRAAAPGDLLQLDAERRSETLQEPSENLAALARRETDARVGRDAEIDATADEPAVHVGARPPVAPRAGLGRIRRRLRERSRDGLVYGHAEHDTASRQSPATIGKWSDLAAADRPTR